MLFCRTNAVFVFVVLPQTANELLKIKSFESRTLDRKCATSHTRQKKTEWVRSGNRFKFIRTQYETKSQKQSQRANKRIVQLMQFHVDCIEKAQEIVIALIYLCHGVEWVFRYHTTLRRVTRERNTDEYIRRRRMSQASKRASKKTRCRQHQHSKKYTLRI